MATMTSAIQSPVHQRTASRLVAVTSAWRTRIAQALCAINGHERYRHLTADRVCLRCLICGHETPGWTLTPARPHERGIAIAASPRVRSIAHRRTA